MSFPYVLQRFVSAKESKEGVVPSNSKTKCNETGKMSGEEARTFYESVLSSDCTDVPTVGTSRKYLKSRKREYEKVTHSCSTDTTDDGDDDYKHDYVADGHNKKPSPRSQRKHIPTSSYPRVVNQFLKNAQEGRLRQLQDLLSRHSIDINVCDQFSWTALMCASHNGQFRVVKYLLEKGALWRNHKDSQGRTALDLARLAKNFDIVDLLVSYKGGIKSKRKKTSKKESCTEKAKFWCSICEQEFSDDKKVHQGSTVHLFNTQRKPQRTFYYIPEGNIGYQMMLKSGWNEDQGMLITHHFSSW